VGAGVGAGAGALLDGSWLMGCIFYSHSWTRPACLALWQLSVDAVSGAVEWLASLERALFLFCCGMMSCRCFAACLRRRSNEQTDMDRHGRTLIHR
jgi:hypothetical protein